MSIVICQLPKAGLGNQLFPLLKAATFASLNDLPLTVIGYHQLKIGPYLRREKSKRRYNGYFSFEKSVAGEQLDRLALRRYRGYEPVSDPEVRTLPGKDLVRKRFLFSAIPHWGDYFAGLREHRELAAELFRGMLDQQIARKAADQPAPCIGVHIRMGDFRKLAAGEDLSSAGAVRTPEPYFEEIIERIRGANGRLLPVSVFTDGHPHEFERLFSLPGVSLISGNRDIVDLLLLSRSSIIVASAGSTFSYWAGFLADAPFIDHPAHRHSAIRPSPVNGTWYEGPFDLAAEGGLLERNIRAITR
jgi:hypothetical protein